jgi:hypothetical protein
MQCLEFRRRLSTDPNIRDEAIRAHARECADCSRWAGKSARLEYLLRRAVEVEVPDNLASRILLRHEFRRARRSSPPRRVFAFAASILVAFVLGGLLLWFESKRSLADDVFVHIDETSYALSSTTILDENTVVDVFRWFGAEISSDVGKVSYANVCTFRDKRVAHVVLQNFRSPVTVMIMPDEQLPGGTIINAGERTGLLLPYAGGSMAIVSERGQRLEDLENQIRSAIRWPTPSSGRDAARS